MLKTIYKVKVNIKSVLKKQQKKNLSPSNLFLIVLKVIPRFIKPIQCLQSTANCSTLHVKAQCYFLITGITMYVSCVNCDWCKTTLWVLKTEECWRDVSSGSNRWKQGIYEKDIFSIVMWNAKKTEKKSRTRDDGLERLQICVWCWGLQTTTTNTNLSFNSQHWKERSL